MIPRPPPATWWPAVIAYVDSLGTRGATAREIAGHMEPDDEDARLRFAARLHSHSNHGGVKRFGIEAVRFRRRSGTEYNGIVYLTERYAAQVRWIKRRCKDCGILQPETEFRLIDIQRADRSAVCAACSAEPVRVRGPQKVCEDVAPRRRLVGCLRCCDLPHARPASGCPECRRPRGELPAVVLDGAARLGVQSWV